ncbi:MAG: acyl-CoA thioesterase II [Micrococcales bacterium]|nr:acyl-CoA thioesterase II [Micrococcales bacterium]
MSDGAQPTDPMERLLQVLDLEGLGTAQVGVTGLPADASASLGADRADIFVGQSEKMPHGRVFGGQVLAQTVMAAGLTMRDVEAEHGPRPIHSLHAYFIRPGDDTQPIQFAVERMRDGASFSARRVHAIQFGKPILSMSCSFQAPADGVDHQDEMPDVPGPDGLASAAELAAAVDGTRARHIESRPIEQRHVEGFMWVDQGQERTATQHVWMRAAGSLPDDPLIHAAVLAYASDFALLEPVLRKHGLVWSDPRLRVASLDHAMWFHRDVRADDWLLYTHHSPSAQGGRGLSRGRMFATDGTLACSVAQEGMIRVKGD